MNMQTPPGTSLAGDGRRGAPDGGSAAVHSRGPVRVHVGSSGGGGFGPGGGGGGRASFAVQVPPKQQRSRTVFEIMDQARALGRNVPGVTVNADIQNPLGGGGGFGGGGTSSINLQLAGPDLDTLNQVGAQVQAALSTVPSLTDVRNTSDQGTPELHIVLDRVRMAQLNVTSQQVATALRTSLSGSQPTVLRPDGQTQQDITLIASDADRLNLVNLSAIPVGGGNTGGGAAAAAAGTAAAAATTAWSRSGRSRRSSAAPARSASSASIATAP